MKNRELLLQKKLGETLSRDEKRLIAAGGPGGVPPKLPPKGQCTVDVAPSICQQWLSNCIANTVNQNAMQACYIEYYNSACACLHP